ncbi:MAG TPA: hypothetical protein VHA13_03675 [Gammaproteobacteria bacterium]|nr:hypothetical protein [Gammaproteobacteria bacterium]
MENEMGYILARGPAGLEEVLATLLEQSKTNPELKSKAQYVLYELGNQKSMIKIDMSVWPVVFWHYDLLGRPATSAVKDILSKFAWEKCGEKEWYYKEKGSSKPQDEAYLDWRSNIFEGKTGTE